MFTEQQQLALIVVPPCTASLSILGSLAIVYDVIRRYGASSNRNMEQAVHYGAVTTRHRLLLGLCVCDIAVSIGLGLSTIPMPVDELPFEIRGAAGTWSTCEVQGFVSQWGLLGVILYEMCMATYYLLVIRHGCSDRQFVSGRVESCMHATVLLLTTGVAFYCLFQDLYNPLLASRWIGSYPRSCTQTWETKKDESTDCIRGDDAYIYNLVFMWAIAQVALVYLTVCMMAIYFKIVSLERVSNSQQRGMGHVQKRQFAIQGTLYVLAFYSSYIMWSVYQFVKYFDSKQNPVNNHFWYIMVATTTTPLHGFWNMFIYFQPWARRGDGDGAMTVQAHWTERKTSSKFRAGGLDEIADTSKDSNHLSANEEIRDSGSTFEPMEDDTFHQKTGTEEEAI